MHIALFYSMRIILTIKGFPMPYKKEAQKDL
jgi:hypothetical protein